jgi:hypothetical protein
MKIKLEDLLDSKVDELVWKIKESDKKALEDVSLFDLILDGDQEQAHVHGVYMFFDPSGKKAVYIGKVQSPQFIERLPCHLAIGEGSWSNQFLKGHRNATSAGSLAETANSARKCKLLLLLASPGSAAKLEALCIKLFVNDGHELYNKAKPRAGLPREIDGGLLVRDILSHN